ncbi:LpqB family beta-propeller domain-containing protein [Hamadaea tsunoensis]|uniref:LpqB family beta-propeller domain-containing protein n=1 Tax=Hamadaea tsunoensis TaxID=53368 RepID=UPI00041B75E1|nr:LpqB family beta-propeller domain-containing protein [Hamadaea tsunoensis]
MDRRTLLRAVALGSLSAVAGCGVASRNGVVVDGPGPSAGQGGTAPGGSQPPPFKSGLTPEALIQNFLRQGAGDPGDLASAIESYLSYLGGDFEPTMKNQLADAAHTKLTVVWYDSEMLAGQSPAITPLGSTGYAVSLPVVVLGTLNQRCVLEPPASGQTTPRIDFTLTKYDDKIHGETLRISNIKNAPPGMIISSDALADYYNYRSVYFWDAAGECLVPDPRHVPIVWDEGVRRKHLMEWQIGDPVSWLASGVTSLTPGATDPPTIVGKNIVVNISHQVLQNGQGQVDASRVITQLTWTLYDDAIRLGAFSPTAESPIKLRIDSTDNRTGGRFYMDNLTAARTEGRAAAAFAILDKDHKVRRLPSGNAEDGSPVPLLESADPAKTQNKDVEWAAMIRDRAHEDEGPATIAVVHRDKSGFSLRVGAARRDGAKAGDDLAVLRDVKLTGQKFLRPGFFDERMIVAVCDGRLYCVPRDGKASATLVTVPNVDGVIQAFALAPDGRRIALVTARGLYVAALSRSGQAVAAGPAQRISTILDQLSGVAFTSENWLAISGRYPYNQTPRIVEISLDGGLVGRTSSSPWYAKIQGTPVITSLTAHPDAPNTFGRARVFYTANGAAWEASGTPTELTPELETLAPVPPHETAVNAFFLE